ncbi:hypothetical protein BJY04DRAFT_217234 [Aspergillus karnatakaensis]|uniref:uncharacterized protein n=1 Tax=Aspergillus karnatakaensis TaxID=1810916 RepID=UPI003CCD8978
MYDTSTGDENGANEDTKAEVDILILDYLVCLAIHRAVDVTDNHPKGWGRIWVEDATTMLMSIHPPSNMPIDLEIKVQILEIIRSFVRLEEAEPPEPTVLAELASTFVSTCISTGKCLKTSAIDIANRLCAHAALIEYERNQRPGHQQGFIENLVDMYKMSKGRRDPEDVSAYFINMPSATGIPVEDWLEAIIQIACYNRAKLATPLNNIVYIMESLDSPVLLQLERGKLGNLTRAETQELKKKIGMY